MSFEEEYEELWKWFRQKTEEYLEACSKDTTEGFDSPLDIVRKLDVKEYNRRLVALKEKYGVK
jgi:hypothetical protein